MRSKPRTRTRVRKGASGRTRGPSSSTLSRRVVAAPQGSALAPFLPALTLATLAALTPLVFWTALREPVVLPKLALTFFLTGIALVCVSAVGGWSRVAWDVCRWPCVLVSAFLLFALVATVTGIDPVRSLLGEYGRYQGFIPLAMYGMLALAALGATAVARSPQPVLWGMLAGGTASAAYGLLQRLGGDPVEWFGLAPGRIGAAFAQPNALGTELVVAAVCGFALWRDARGSWRVVLAAALAMIALVLLLTLSRGAWVAAALALTLLLFLFVRRVPTRREALFGGSALVLVVGVALALPGGRDLASDVAHRARTAVDLDETSNSQRLGLWRMALDMIADRPLLGFGPDAFSQRFAAYRDPDQPGLGTMNVRPESSHSIVLDTAVGLGLPGLALWLAALGAAVWAVVRAVPRLREPHGTYARALLVALAGYYTAVLFSFAEGMTGWIPWLLIGTSLGIVAARAPEDVTWRRQEWPRWLTPGAAVGYVGALALMVFALMLVVADAAAQRGLEVGRAGDLPRGVDLLRTASRWNPLQPVYLLDLGVTQQNAGLYFGRQYFVDAVETFETLNSRFDPTAFSLIQEAQARARLTNMERSEDRAQVFALLERAVALDPYNAEIRQAIIRFYETAGEPERAERHRAELAGFDSEAAAATR